MKPATDYPLSVEQVESYTRAQRLYARELHRSFASWHEAYAVIREELDEFWDSVKVNEPNIRELAQVAACCQLAMLELSHTRGE